MGRSKAGKLNPAGDKNVVEAFSMMLKGGGAISECYGKYFRLAAGSNRYMIAVKTLGSVLAAGGAPEAAQAAEAHLASIARANDECFGDRTECWGAATERLRGARPDLAGVAAGTPFAALLSHDNFGCIPDEVAKACLESLKAAKDCETIAACLDIGRELKKYESHISGETPTMAFITRMKASTYCPFAGIRPLDLKAIAIEGSDDTKRLILRLLAKFVELSKNMVDDLSIPEVSSREFADIVRSAMERLKRDRALKSCHGALNLILRSLDQFETGFKTKYYKSFEITGDPSAVVQEFLGDVATSLGDKSEGNLPRQFRILMARLNKGGGAPAPFAGSKKVAAPAAGEEAAAAEEGEAASSEGSPSDSGAAGPAGSGAAGPAGSASG